MIGDIVGTMLGTIVGTIVGTMIGTIGLTRQGIFAAGSGYRS